MKKQHWAYFAMLIMYALIAVGTILAFIYNGAKFDINGIILTAYFVMVMAMYIFVSIAFVNFDFKDDE